ncbi:isochorismatase family protein [Pseudodesulfovibrio cashew]|uniref:Isochorismatase family protein n=1 Tax=Pseudodesulfovibrio cashew TaxID=2678688 RepID=A0A6I6JEB3_9BACT|nr:cysteine hydrolase [Pseudodesulfovibrio cashew]QGY38762.1 isochorismatase family protein [Pseudodesulfovibrio cashew]
MRTAVTAALFCLLALLPASAFAGDTVVDRWEQAVPPAPPKIKPVAVNAADTALLVLDIEERTCNAERRPRCLDTVPRIAALLKRAREHGMPVIYSQISSPTPILDPVRPHPGEPVVSSSVDKFYGTELEAILTKAGAKTVIITGTAAHGAVLHTATGAARRGLNVVIPADCLSAASLYTEQAAVWCLVDGPGTRKRTTLTTSDLITIR